MRRMIFYLLLLAATPAVAEDYLVQSAYGPYAACLIARVHEGVLSPIDNVLPTGIGAQTYSLFDLTGKIGDLPGDAPAESTCMDSAAVAAAFPPSDEKYWAPRLATSVPTATTFSLIEKLDPEDPSYVDAVRVILDANGKVDSPVRITQVINVDLEGDGIEEQLITAWIAGGSDDPHARSDPKDYALIALRREVEGRSEVTLVRGYFDAGWAVSYEVVALVDLTGDGQLELAIAVEGIDLAAQMLFQLEAGVFTFVASCGCFA